MSHFNLNNGMPRKRYIGPTHGLPCRPGTASLENLGGRIIIENEMSNHKLRLKQIKPSIDASKPWAHDYQDSKLRKMSPSRMSNSEGGANSPSSTSLPPATAVRGYGYNPNRSNSSAAAGGGGGSLNASKGKSSPANGRQQQQQGGSNSSSSAAHHHPISFDVTALSPEHQKTYTDLVQLLSTLPQRESKSLLEQAYREGEERKLLMAYTGGFPDAKGKGGSHHDKKDEPKKRGDYEGTKGKVTAASHERSGHTAVPYNASDAASDAAPSHSPSSSSTTKGKAVGGSGGLSSSQLLRKKVLESSSKSDADDGDISRRHEKRGDHNDDEGDARDRMGMSGVSAHSRPSTRGSVASGKRHDDDGDDSFEKDDEDE